MVYGVLVESVRDCIKKEFGNPIWKKIEEKLNLEGIVAHTIYPDEIFSEIIDCLILFNEYEELDFDSYMEIFGNSFVGFFSRYGYERLLKIAGRSFGDFIRSIDQLHQSNNYSFPLMKSPLFYVTSEDSDGLFLSYQTKRRGFNHYVIGQLKECSKVLFNLEIQMRIHEDLSNDEYNHVVFRIDFKNGSFKKQNHKSESTLSIDLPESIKSEVFMDVFPCSIGFNKNFKIKQIGSLLEKLFDDLYNLNFFESFTLTRPLISDMKWDKLIELSGSVIFELENVHPLKSQQKEKTEKSLVKLHLQGQMKFDPDLDLILFIGHPKLNSIEEMLEIGIFLNDLNQFDSSGEMIVRNDFNSRKLKNAFEELHEWSSKLEANKSEVNQWRRKSKNLLYSMLPYGIAVKIEEGIKPNSICQTYECATILFLNTAEFSSLISSAEPTEIVRFINSTILVYDRVVDTYENINKIETKADGSYMVVAGLNSDGENSFERKRTGSISSITSSLGKSIDGIEKKSFPDYNQVELISELALELVKSVETLKNPFQKALDSGDSDSLKIKIGFHTGSIVAGIVGISRVQFCLFGDTVNTSSRMCSNSLPGRISFSESSYEFLKDSEYFEIEFRDKITVKGKGEMSTYWLNGKKSN